MTIEFTKMLTNNYHTFLSELKEKIKNINAHEDELVMLKYLFLPSLGNGHFTIFLIENKKNGSFKIAKQVWDYPNLQNHIGIYDTDKIVVTKKEICLQPNEQDKLKQMIGKVDLSVLDSNKGIFLDGAVHKFSISYNGEIKEYEWITEKDKAVKKLEKYLTSFFN